MTFFPYLSFPGTAREAMGFYAGLFGASDLQIMSNGDAPPDQAMPGPSDAVMHAQFSTAPGVILMGADLPPGVPPQTGAVVYHAAASKAEAERVFTALAEGGQVMMPLMPTFWSPAFSMLTDRFGTGWLVTVAEGVS